MKKERIVTIQDDYSSWNGSRHIYFQCEEIAYHEPLPYGWHGLGKPVRCGRDSMYLLSFSDNPISKHVCEEHVKFYKEKKGENIK